MLLTSLPTCTVGLCFKNETHKKDILTIRLTVNDFVNETNALIKIVQV